MSNFLKENANEQKYETSSRVQMLTQKINNLKFGHKAEAERKFEMLETQIDGLEGELDSTIASISSHCLDVKHIFNKIHKELTFDYATTDCRVKQELKRCEQMCAETTSEHIDERKSGDARLSKFIDEKCGILRDLIEREASQRSSKGKQIEQFLVKDLSDIRSKLEVEKRSRVQTTEQIHCQFMKEYEKMKAEFAGLCEKYSDSESQFLTMLRDVLKKVKSQIAEGKREREHMEETILKLIEQLCDKAMEGGAP